MENYDIKIKSKKTWTDGVKQRICSKHFVDKEPTYENPAPTINLEYDSEIKAKRQNLVNSRRVLEFQSTETSTVVSSSSTTLHATTRTTTATKTITPTTTLPLTTRSLQRTEKHQKQYHCCQQQHHIYHLFLYMLMTNHNNQ